MLHGMANLHRAGVGAQQVGGGGSAALHIKRIVHGTRRMVFRRVQRSEVEPVGLDLGALSHIETHGAENALDALQRERHRVQTALPALAAWQAHIQGLGLELGLQLGISQCLTTGGQCGFDRLLGQVDGSATGLLLFDGQLRHPLHELRHTARFAQKLRLGVFQLSRGSALCKQLLRAFDQRIQLVHIDSLKINKG